MWKKFFRRQYHQQGLLQLLRVVDRDDTNEEEHQHHSQLLEIRLQQHHPLYF